MIRQHASWTSRGTWLRLLALALLPALAACGQDEDDDDQIYAGNLDFGYSNLGTAAPFPSSQWKDAPFTPHDSPYGWELNRRRYTTDEDWLYFVDIATSEGAVQIRGRRESWMDFITIEIDDPAGRFPRIRDIPVEWRPATVHRSLAEVRAIERLTPDTDESSMLVVLVRILPGDVERRWGDLPVGDYRIRMSYDTRAATEIDRIYARGPWRPLIIRPFETDDDRLNLIFREAERHRAIENWDEEIACYKRLIAEKSGSYFLHSYLQGALMQKAGYREYIDGAIGDVDTLKEALAVGRRLVEIRQGHMDRTAIDPDYYPPDRITRVNDWFETAYTSSIEDQIRRVEETKKKGLGNR